MQLVREQNILTKFLHFESRKIHGKKYETEKKKQWNEKNVWKASKNNQNVVIKSEEN